MENALLERLHHSTFKFQLICTIIWLYNYFCLFHIKKSSVHTKNLFRKCRLSIKITFSVNKIFVFWSIFNSCDGFIPFLLQWIFTFSYLYYYLMIPPSALNIFFQYHICTTILWLTNERKLAYDETCFENKNKKKQNIKKKEKIFHPKTHGKSQILFQKP